MGEIIPPSGEKVMDTSAVGGRVRTIRLSGDLAAIRDDGRDAVLWIDKGDNGTVGGGRWAKVELGRLVSF